MIIADDFKAGPKRYMVRPTEQTHKIRRSCAGREDALRRIEEDERNEKLTLGQKTQE
jgi:hypothetical protein